MTLGNNTPHLLYYSNHAFECMFDAMPKKLISAERSLDTFDSSKWPVFSTLLLYNVVYLYCYDKFNNNVLRNERKN